MMNCRSCETTVIVGCKRSKAVIVKMEEVMTGLEVFLIIAGFACICISFFVSRKKAAGLEDDGEAVRSSAV